MPDEEVQVFLDSLSTHDFSVPTGELEDAYGTLHEVTDGFETVTPESLATAIRADRIVVREVLRLSANFHSMDSWSTLLSSELPLEHSSKDAIVNEIQRRIDDDEFRTTFYEFATDVLGDDLRGEREEFTHWDVVEARYLTGKGSALRGQASGDWLEDKIGTLLENLGLREGEQFVHVDGRATVTVGDTTFDFEKGPDFVIPGLDDARVIIEAKAYVSSTGSKQTDVLGDVSKLEPIVNRGASLFMVVDGPMWRRRVSDLEALFAKRDAGVVAGIYQVETLEQLRMELKTLLEDLDRSET